MISFEGITRLFPRHQTQPLSAYSPSGKELTNTWAMHSMKHIITWVAWRGNGCHDSWLKPFASCSNHTCTSISHRVQHQTQVCVYQMELWFHRTRGFSWLQIYDAINFFFLLSVVPLSGFITFCWLYSLGTGAQRGRLQALSVLLMPAIMVWILLLFLSLIHCGHKWYYKTSCDWHNGGFKYLRSSLIESLHNSCICPQDQGPVTWGPYISFPSCIPSIYFKHISPTKF